VAAKTGGQIVFEQETAGDLWARVPERVVADDRINGNALRVYCALHIVGVEARLRNGPGYEGQEKLGERCGGMSGKAVHRALKQLVDAGYVETEHVGQGQPDNITIKRLP